MIACAPPPIAHPGEVVVVEAVDVGVVPARGHHLSLSPLLPAAAVEEPAEEVVGVEAVKGCTMPAQGHHASHGPSQPTQMGPVAGPHSAAAVGQPAQSRTIKRRDNHRGGARWLPHHHGLGVADRAQPAI